MSGYRDAAQTGCIVTLNPQLVITQPAQLNATVAATNVTCFGASDGTISVTNPSGGYGTYEYSINGGGSWHPSGLFTDLVPGNYNVRIRDAANNTCVIILNPALQITQPPVLNAVAGQRNGNVQWRKRWSDKHNITFRRERYIMNTHKRRMQLAGIRYFHQPGTGHL